MRTIFCALLAGSFATIACGSGERLPEVTQDSASATAAKDAALASTDSAPAPRTVGEFRAVGNEPFWAVQVNASGITLKTPEQQGGIVFPVPLPRIEGKKFHWASSTPAPNAHTIDITIVEGECSDTMSDKKWTHTASVVIDGRLLTGCAEGGLGANYRDTARGVRP